MADRVLRTILSGRDELTSVLTKAAASTRAFENTVEDANIRAARSSTTAAAAHKTAAAGVVSATKQAHTAVAGMGDDFEREGTRAGGLLAQGVRNGVMRNSPLIIAAVSAALVAGAPLLLGAAATLFGTIGVVAAAQADRVQSTWVGTWDYIKDVTISAAEPIEDTLVGVGERVAAWYQRLGPRLAVGFREAAPLVDIFADSVMNAADNALPGMLRAVYRAEPVMEGLGSLMESIGTGLSDMFDAMSQHSEAAGRSAEGLGGTFEVLLPLLGEFLGQGAELAADVLPALNGSLGLLLATTRLLGPALPFIITGLSAMKIGKSIAGGLDSAAASLGRVAANGGKLAGVAGGASTALAGIAGSAGAAGAAIGFLALEAYAWTEAGRQSEEVALRLGRAMEIGGQSAQGAAQFLEQFNGINDFMADGIGRSISSISFLGYSFQDFVPDAQQAKEVYQEWYEGLDAGAKAAEDVAVAQQALRDAVAEHGPASDDAARAADRLAAAQAEVARIAADEEMAIRGVTQAMLDQTDAVMAATNADYAHRVAMDQANDSFAAMNEAVAQYGPNSEEARDAALAFEGDLLRVSDAALRLAEESLPSAMDAEQKHALAQLQTLDRLHELEAQYGDALPGSIREMIAELERSTAGYDRAALEAAELKASTDQAKSAMEGLGDMNVAPTIDADDKMIRAKTDGALAGLRNLAGQRPTPPLNADDGPVRGKTLSALAGLRNFAAQRPTPPLNADGRPAAGQVGKAMGILANFAGQRPTPILSARDNATPTVNQVLAKIAAVQSRTVTITTNHVAVYRTVGSPMVASTLADGGPIRAATGVKIRGIGGPRDDLVRAYVPGGQEYRVSPGEWIVNAAASRRQGDAAMAALNAGLARVVPNPPTAQPGYSPGSGGWGRGGTAAVQLNVSSATVSGRVQLDSDGLATLVDGRITDVIAYMGTRAS